MADETEKTKGTASVIHALLSFIPSELREMVGFFSGFVLVFAVPVAVILGVMTADESVASADPHDLCRIIIDRDDHYEPQ